MLVKQRGYDRAIVKKLFFKLKAMSVMVARKKQHTGPKRRSFPISHSITKVSHPVNQFINSAIHGQKNVSHFTPILSPAPSISCWVPV